jgi:hypothetical protein
MLRQRLANRLMLNHAGLSNLLLLLSKVSQGTGTYDNEVQNASIVHPLLIHSFELYYSLIKRKTERQSDFDILICGKVI